MIRRAFGAVLLDLDGCLLDSNDAHARAWSRTLSAFGRSVPAARVREEIGKGGKELVRDFVTPVEHAMLAGAMGRTETELYLRRFSRIRPFPGAAEAVRAMSRAGIRVVLASSAARRVVERSVARLRIGRALRGFTSADDVEKAKPFDDIFSLAIRRFRLERSVPAAVGDSPYDIAAAHQIGIPCLALRSGGFPERTLSSADRVFDGLAQMWSEGRELFAA